MIKNINVSTKITILILAITLIAVASISFFSYDFHRKSAISNNTGFLTSVANNYASYFSTYFERAGTALEILKNAPAIVSNTSGATPSGGGDFFAVSMDMPSD